MITFAQIKDSGLAARFELIMLEEAKEFVLNLPKAAMKKVLDNVHRIAEGERNAIIFSKLEGTEIWEFRTLYDKVKYRLFAFWDTQTDTLVVATHGIIKKTQKTPPKEIAKAERIRQEYFNAKKR